MQICELCGNGYLAGKTELKRCLKFCVLWSYGQLEALHTFRICSYLPLRLNGPQTAFDSSLPVPMTPRSPPRERSQCLSVQLAVGRTQ